LPIATSGQILCAHVCNFRLNAMPTFATLPVAYGRCPSASALARVNVQRPGATPRELALAYPDALGTCVSLAGSARQVAVPRTALAILVVRRVRGRLGRHGCGQLVDGAAVFGRFLRKE